MIPIDAARRAAKVAWHKSHPSGMWHDEAFEAAMRAYVIAIADPVNGAPRMPPPKADRPRERSVKEHFLALSTGYYVSYMMTKGRTGSVGRDVICFQPDAKSSVLLPLFMSVHPAHDALTDEQGRKFDQPIID